MRRKKSLVAIANEQVSFLAAAKWAGLDTGARDRGMVVTCPSCGGGGALRVYPGHGYCFGEGLYFSPVSLLALHWAMDREHAAITALKKIDYVPAGYAHLWDQAAKPPEPNRDALGQSLLIWCAAQCPDWATRQYDPAVARKLAACLGVLPKVHTAEQCSMWREKSKTIMGRVLPLAELT